MAHGALLQTKGFVELFLFVRDGTRLGPACRKELLCLLGRPEVDEQNRRETPMSCSIAQLLDVTPAEGSPEVPQEDQERRLLQILS